jgi:dihydroorotase-like cyclic amidohydrolase
MNTVSIHDCETGTRAAAFGGVTTVIDFSNQSHGESLFQSLEDKKAEASGRARLAGLDIHAETCVHYLVLTEEQMKRPDGIKRIIRPGAYRKSHFERRINH